MQCTHHRFHKQFWSVKGATAAGFHAYVEEQVPPMLTLQKPTTPDAQDPRTQASPWRHALATRRRDLT